MSTLAADGYFDTSLICVLSELRDRSHRFRGDQSDAFLVEFLRHLNRSCRLGSFVNPELCNLKAVLEKETSKLGQTLTLEDISAALKKMVFILQGWMQY